MGASKKGESMASARAMIERRRSSRILTHIPVQVSGDSAPGRLLDTRAEAIAVSRFGALLRTCFSPALGSRIEVQNGGETGEFRVVRVKDASNGLFELGIEILYPARNFWGLQFPDEPCRV
jgi:hypothetical protein